VTRAERRFGRVRELPEPEGLLGQSSNFQSAILTKNRSAAGKLGALLKEGPWGVVPFPRCSASLMDAIISAANGHSFSVTGRRPAATEELALDLPAGQLGASAGA